MIPEYKLFHGAVLAELVDCMHRSIAIDELVEDGRLTTYVLDGHAGLHIKHSMQRLSPWQFTFTQANVHELGLVGFSHEHAFVVLVCHTDGMVCLTLDELKSLLAFGQSDQAWVRISRHRGEWYSVCGSGGDLGRKRPEGLDMIVQCLTAAHQPAV
jgi:hypothetical protein